jgi:hypothetical protein
MQIAAVGHIRFFGDHVIHLRRRTLNDFSNQPSMSARRTPKKAYCHAANGCRT